MRITRYLKRKWNRKFEFVIRMRLSMNQSITAATFNRFGYQTSISSSSSSSSSSDERY